MNEKSNNKLIAKNTLLLYFRQILILLVSLYTVRIVLEILGAEDYGIYNVIAGFVTLISFISGAMATASQRYFSFELGRKDFDKLKKTFSLMLTIYCILAVIIAIFAESFGLWFVYTKLVIPPERLMAAKCIYQFSVLSLMLTIVTTPYMSAIIAHENMDVYAYMSIVEAALKLVVVFVLKMLPYDKLVVYGILLFVIACIVTGLYRYYCKQKYGECRFSFYWNRMMFREITSYVGWNLFGAGASVAKNYGISIMLNQYFGAVVNAARAISFQVSGAVASFSQNFSTAVRPQIIKNYASDQTEEMLSLVYRSCKGTFYLMYLFTLPLFLEMPYVLKLWLKNPPAYTILFTRLALVDVLIDSVSYPIMTMAHATGKIRLYQGIVGGVLLCNFPVSIFVLHCGAPAYSVMIIAAVLTFVALILRLYISRFLILSFSFSNFTKQVLLTVFLIAFLSAIVPCLVLLFMRESFLRLALIIILSVVFISLSTYALACSKKERMCIRKEIFRLLCNKR